MNFNQVKESLENKTRETNNFISIIRGGRDSRDPHGGYHTYNVITNQKQCYFKTLKEIVNLYNLEENNGNI